MQDNEITDYSRLLDAEVMRFCAETSEVLPALSPDASVDEHRQAYLELCRHFAAPHPQGLTIQDRTLKHISYRTYRPEHAHPDKIMLYFHGGGFVLGNLESHDSICADISHLSGLTLIAVDYRLAPEFQHPVPLSDCLSVTEYIHTQYPDAQLYLAGDSAGAWLAAMVSDRLNTDSQTISGQVLIYPTLSGDLSWPSYNQHSNAPGLTTAEVRRYGQLLFGADTDPEDADGPLKRNDFAHLPPSCIFSAECDPLHDDGPEYARRLHNAGVDAMCVTQRGLIHGYLRGRYHAQRIAQAFDEIIDGIRQLTARPSQR